MSGDKTYVLSIMTDNIDYSNGYTLNAPYRSGYTFGGWTTVEDGSVAEYEMGNLNYLGALANTTLYAIWIAD